MPPPGTPRTRIALEDLGTALAPRSARHRPGATDPRQLRRALAMADRPGDRAIAQLLTAASGAQQEAASAHVAAADEGLGEHQALAEHVEQRIDVLAGGDAAEQHDAGIAPAVLAE